MSLIQLISKILDRRGEIVAACLGASHSVDVAQNNFSALFFAGGYSPLDWEFCPEPLPIPRLVGIREDGNLYPAEDKIPERYQELDGNFIESLQSLVNSPLIDDCKQVSFDKQTGRMTFYNGDELLFRSTERVNWLPQPVIIDNPEILTLLK